MPFNRHRKAHSAAVACVGNRKSDDTMLGSPARAARRNLTAVRSTVHPEHSIEVPAMLDLIRSWRWENMRGRREGAAPRRRCRVGMRVPSACSQAHSLSVGAARAVGWPGPGGTPWHPGPVGCPAGQPGSAGVTVIVTVTQ